MDYGVRTRYSRGNTGGQYGFPGSRGGFSGGSRGSPRGGPWRRTEQTWSGAFIPYIKPPAVPAAPRPAFGPLIRSITVSDIDVEDESVPAVITDCELVGSYNWLGSTHPSILIPGGPPRWTPLARPRPLQNDSGTYLRDINSARLPLYPMEPVARAVCQGLNSQKGAARDIDIVACDSTFVNLLRFIRRDELEPGGCKPFRLVAQLVGRDKDRMDGKDGKDGKGKATLFLVRRENAPDECIPDIIGFGFAFSEAYTTWDAATKTSESHQRIIKYHFGGLTILLRFEADGYFPQAREKSSSDALRPAAEQTGIDNFDSLFASVSIDTQPASASVGPAAAAGTEDRLRVQHGGTSQPQPAVFDIKTRSFKKKEQRAAILEEDMPRLWCRQTPTVVLAFHNRGKFAPEDIEMIDVRHDAAQWQQDHQASLQKLAALLRMVLDQVHSLPQGTKLEICHTEGEGADDCLVFREPGPGAMDALSGQGRRLWTGQDDDGEGDGDSSHEEKGDEKGDEEEEDKEDDEKSSPRCSVYFSASDGSDADLGELDYTACSSSGCGYCGRCPY